MLRRLRNLILVLVFAVLGAVAGRVAAEARGRQRSGQDPTGIDLGAVTLRPRDVIPGLAVAMRVGRRPWSFLHIPPWLAAFATNFGVAMYGAGLDGLRGTAPDETPDWSDAAATEFDLNGSDETAFPAPSAPESTSATSSEGFGASTT
jgi:hypothetical protein